MKIIIAILILVTVIVILYPKECGQSYSDFVIDVDNVYRQECSCLGYKYSGPPDKCGSSKCVGGEIMEYCIGIPLGMNCYSMELNKPETESPVECR